MKFTEYMFGADTIEARMPAVTKKSLELVEALSSEDILPLVTNFERDMMAVNQPRLWDVANRLSVVVGMKMVSDWLNEDTEISRWIEGLSLSDKKELMRLNVLGVLDEVHQGFVIGNLVASERLGASKNRAGSPGDISVDTYNSFKDRIAIDNVVTAIKVRTPRYTWRLASAMERGLDIDYPNDDYEEAAKLGALVCYTMRTFESSKKRERLQFDHEWHDHEAEESLFAAAMVPEPDWRPTDTFDRIYTERRREREMLQTQPSHVRHWRFLRNFRRHGRK